MEKVKTQVQVERITWSLVKAFATSRSITLNAAVGILLCEGLAKFGYVTQSCQHKGTAAGPINERRHMQCIG
jgi:hypothetical protein